MFTKARQNRIFQDIVDQVQEAIVRGELQPGERLPAEREMCSIFNTSRGTLREALRILEQKRLITIKLGAGGGAVVREANGELIRENLLLLVRRGQASGTDLASLAAENAALTGSRAANRAGADDVEPLKKLVNRLSTLLSEDRPVPVLRREMDRILFAELARIAGNPLSLFLLTAALDALDRLRVSSAGDRDTLKAHYQEIRKIVYAVATNEPAQAARLIRSHLLQPVD